ncbi:hypothetical protein F4823DRAFT_599042 [Ustulina deusta]|nr:hypothetical protein F4823DRAFT_599042 [Ustulina deusta]
MKKVPGSAMKNTHANNRHVVSAAEAAAQLAQKKENLYGDLTGLLVCGVKRENDDEVFDCVQTGRHGSKFKTKQRATRRLTVLQRFISNCR